MANLKQEPVLDLDGHVVRDARKPKKAALAYIAPPKREWVGLTDEELSKIWGGIIKNAPSETRLKDFARAVEQLLKEKNNGL